MRASNAAELLRTIWSHADGITRPAISRLTGLSRSTVSGIVHELMAAGQVEESHVAKSSGGRPPVVIRFKDAAFHVVGVEMGASHVTAVLSDLRGRIVASVRTEYDVQGDPPGTLRVLGDFIARCIEALPAGSRLVGIGIGVPCPVDATLPDHLSERILPAWRDVRLAGWVHRRFGTRVFVENDANLGALAEHRWGVATDVDHFTYIKVATGVGAGHVIGGEIFRGAAGIAGEIGHSAVLVDGRQCRCGLHGCLEAQIGSQSIVDQARERLRAGETSALADQPELSLADVVAAARSGDGLALSLIEDAGRYLGIAVANLLNLMNPAKVVVGGRLTAAGDLLLQPLRRTIRDRALWTSIERAEVSLSELGDEQVALGAATLVIQAALADPCLLPGPTARDPLEVSSSQPNTPL